MSLESLSFQRSADVLVMLVLGRHRALYGGIVGAIVYMMAHDQLSGMAPQYWYFWIGVLLVIVVMFLPNGILGGLSKILRDGAANERHRTAQGRRDRKKHDRVGDTRPVEKLRVA